MSPDHLFNSITYALKSKSLYALDLKSPKEVDDWFDSMNEWFNSFKVDHGEEIVLIAGELVKVKDLELDDPKFNGGNITTSLRVVTPSKEDDK